MEVITGIFYLCSLSTIPIWIGIGLFYGNKKVKRLLDFNKIEWLFLLIAIYFLWGYILLLINGIGRYVFHFDTELIYQLYEMTFRPIIRFDRIMWMTLLLMGVTLHRKPPEGNNPLDWITLDRCVLYLWIYALIGTASSSFRHNLSLISGPPSYYANPFPVMISVTEFSINGLYFCLIIIGLSLRNKYQKNRIYPQLVIQTTAIHQSLLFYFYGGLNHLPTFLLGLSQSALMVILFEFSLAIPGVLTFFFLITLIMIGVWTDLLPFAPGYAPFFFANQISDFFYSGSSFFFMIFTSLLILSFLSYIVYRWRDRELKVANMSTLLKKMFGRYLSVEVMNSILENPSILELGGERRIVTIMMTDLRGFTALTERLYPEQVLQMLNSYFEEMVEIILKYNGTINEIIGDALLVIFGAPEEVPDRTHLAIACAIEMQNIMAKVNEQNRLKGLPDLEMGIGLNDVEVIVGNIGSSKRSKYGVVGSGVNMTSRIESYTVGGQILISDSVKKEAGDILRIDEQREVTPKGSEAPIKLYDVGGISGRYNLVLEETDPEVVILSHPIPIKYKVLEGKKIGKDTLKGFIIRLSKKCAEIRLESSVEILTNSKMNLDNLDKSLSTADIYGKIFECYNDEKLIYRIRFTSVPPEVASYFRAHIEFGTTPAPIGSL